MSETRFGEVNDYLQKKEAQHASPEELGEKSPPPELSLNSLKEIPEAYREAALEIISISGTWNPVEIYTAGSENLAREKAKFIEAFEAGEAYLPQLSYPGAESLEMTESHQRLAELRTELLSMQHPKEDRISRLARVVLVAKIQDDLATCDLVDGIKNKDEARIKAAIDRKYQPLDPVLRQVAHEDYEKLTHQQQAPSNSEGILSKDQQAFLKEQTLNAPEIKEAFEWGLKKLGILREADGGEGLQVVIDDSATAIDVRDKTKQGPTIFIPTTRRIDGERVLGLLNHEIGCHARQSINGVKLFEVGGGTLKVDDETLYEGLAMRAENAVSRELFGKKGDNADPFYTLAAEKAGEGASFSGIHQHIYELQLHVALKIAPQDALPSRETIPDAVHTRARDEAWRITYRVMRGHTDMANPEAYAMTKDLAYLRGAHLDEELVEAGFGHINEAAIIAGGGGLRAIAEFDIQETDIPIPSQDLARLYWQEVLQPKYESQQAQRIIEEI